MSEEQFNLINLTSNELRINEQYKTELDKINSENRDILALLALGANVEFLSDTYDQSQRTTARRLSSVYDVLGLGDLPQRKKQELAREIALKGGLLEEAWGEINAEQFLKTRKLFKELGLNSTDILLMGNHSLMADELLQLKLIAKGLKYEQVGNRVDLTPQGVGYRQKVIRQKIGETITNELIEFLKQ